MPTTPAPIIVEPNGEFLGNDGSWSMFEIQVGIPGQKVQVLPSTMLSQTLVVIPSGCSAASGDPSNCIQARGGAYDSSKSSHWTSKNIFPLNVEVNLGLIHNSDNGAYGYDELSIATENGGNVTLDQQLLSGVATKDFFLGSLGLSSAPITFDNPPDVRQSLITSLKNASLIPSLSYGYTAGASYRNQTGSLTLGGYDTSRFVPNDVSIELADNNLLRQQVVALKSVTYSDSNTTDGSLLTDGILTLIDTTVPHIWLPLDACRKFEDAFGISYEPISNLYLVNSDTHDDLVKQNATITFEIGSSIGASPSVNITLPYDSFDLNVGYPLIPKNKAPSKYFPLRRAADNTQYTLGRAFLQESYLIVDYESKNFSISQAMVSPPPAQIVPITVFNVTETSSPTPSGTPTGGPAIVKASNHHSRFPVGAIAGIVVAVIIIVLAVGCFFLRKSIGAYIQRRKLAKKERKEKGDRKELPADAPHPRDHQEVDAVDAETGREKMGAAGAASPYTDLESPPIEMSGNPIDFKGYYGKGDHGDRKELGSAEPFPRSELSSPEPISRQQSPNLIPTQHSELPTPDPQCAEIASPLDSARPSPHYDPYSALSSPRLPRPKLGSRRSAHDRASTTTTSDESGLNQPSIMRNDSQHSQFSKDGTPLRLAHIRRDSEDSGFTQETLTGRTPRPRSVRQDSTESGFTKDTIPRRPSQHQRINSDDSGVSDPLMSPRPLSHHPLHPPRDSTMDPHLEEELDQDSDSPLVGASEPQTAQVARRGSGNLIQQMSPPASPGKPSSPAKPSSPEKPSIPRKEVASPSPAHGHRRQESSVSGAPPSAFQSPQLGGEGFHSHSRMRSSSSASGSKFEENFTEEVGKK